MILTHPSASRGGIKAWFGLAVLALPTLLVSMDATVTFLAIPALSLSLRPTATQLLWITDIYTFLEGGLLIIMGVLGDKIGRKKLLMTGTVAFALASLLAAFANSAGMLIFARALLGIAGATILPCTLSLIRNLFHDEKQRAMAFGIYTTIYSAGTMLGPFFGGILLTHFWWGSVFLMNIPVMIVFMLVSSLLPEYKDPHAGRFDLWSASMLTGSFLLIVYGIKKLAEHGSMTTLEAGSIAAGALLTVIFLYRQRIIVNPIISLSLFRNKIFTYTLALLFFSLFCWSGLNLFVTQYLQLIKGLNPYTAGILTIIPACLSMAACLLAPFFARTFRKENILIAGMLVMLAGTWMITRLDSAGSVVYLVMAAALLSSGCGIVVTIGINLVVSSVPQEQAGAASGISESSTTFGTALGIALLGSLGNWIFRFTMGGHDGLHSLGTMSEALEYSRELAHPIRENVLLQSELAFTRSFEYAAAASSIVIIVAVILFRINMRRRSSGMKPEPVN